MKLLLIEDDRSLCTVISRELQRNGHTVDCCYDGETAMLYALNLDYGYDLAIIDRMLPIVDGLTVIKAMRKKQISIPVIIITGMSELNDRIIGLDGGADDYLVKPFHLQELLARIRALTRRSPSLQCADTFSFGDLTLHYSVRKLSCMEKECSLTAKETELLSVFLKQPENVFTREQLVLKVWGSDADIESGNVDNYISFLRKRLRELKSNCVIRTIYGTGYRLEDGYA